MVAEKSIVNKSYGRKEVPDYLIREMIDGQPFYYKGYKDVLRKQKTLEAIMGSSSLQALLSTYLISVCVKNNFNHHYILLAGGVGLQTDPQSHLNCGTLIFDPTVLTPEKITNNYPDVPPKLALLIDDKVEIPNHLHFAYIRKKIEKLHQFGTEKVIWILTASRQVIIALPNQPWLVYDWNEAIEILDGVTFNIGEYLKKKGVELPD